MSARFLLRRVLATLPILLAAVVFTFALTRLLPGDAADSLAGGTASPQEVAELRGRLGLDAPLPTQLVRYLGQLAHGDWGRSHLTGQPVLADLAQRLPASIELTLVGFALATLLGVPLGVVAAMKPNSMWDRLCSLLATLGTCAPAFVVGLVLVYVFYFRLGWAPEPIGRIDVMIAAPPVMTGSMVVDSLLAGDLAALRSAVGHLLLPAVAMALFGLAPLARATRSSMLAALAADPVRTARALGLHPARVLLRYGLHNALLPVVTTLGMVFSYMLGTNVVVEKVFAWPGIGSYALDALMSADHAPVQGFVLTVTLLFAVVNLGIDLIYGAVDPRTELAS